VEPDPSGWVMVIEARASHAENMRRRLAVFFHYVRIGRWRLAWQLLRRGVDDL
jgi:hypothetical protein